MEKKRSSPSKLTEIDQVLKAGRLLRVPGLQLTADGRLPVHRVRATATRSESDDTYIRAKYANVVFFGRSFLFFVLSFCFVYYTIDERSRSRLSSRGFLGRRPLADRVVVLTREKKNENILPRRRRRCVVRSEKMIFSNKAKRDNSACC